MLRWIILICILSAYAHSAYADSSVILLMKGSFTTNTRIYSTDDPQAIGDLANVSANYGIGAEVRFRTFWERWVVGIDIEKITGSIDQPALYQTSVVSLVVPRKDGYELLPIELSAYYSVPISSNTFEFYLGGGFGYYSGKRNFSIGTTASRSTEITHTLGLQVSTGVRWRFTRILALDVHLRFRDPQITAVNMFDQATTRVQGYEVPLPQGPSTTQVNLNGINYSAGLAIVF